MMWRSSTVARIELRARGCRGITDSQREAVRARRQDRPVDAASPANLALRARRGGSSNASWSPTYRVAPAAYVDPLPTLLLLVTAETLLLDTTIWLEVRFDPLDNIVLLEFTMLDSLRAFETKQNYSSIQVSSKIVVISSIVKITAKQLSTIVS